MTTSISSALQQCAWMAARDTNGLNVDNVGLTVAVAARLADAGIVSLEQLDLLLVQHRQQQEDTEPALDDDAARDRMNRTRHITPLYTDPDGTRWEPVEQTTSTIACPGHHWMSYGKDEYGREQRTCRNCGTVLAKLAIQA